jgi:hypothetical protein
MNDKVEERAALVEAIIRRSRSPTLEDAVAVLQFEYIKDVSTLFEIDLQLQKAWWEQKDSRPME